MKTLASILAVAAVVVAVTMSPASDAQVLSNDEMGSFVGACCVPTYDNGEYCTDQCWTHGEAQSKTYYDTPDWQQRVCIFGLGDCTMTATIACGSSYQTKLFQFYNNQYCGGTPISEDQSYDDIATAAGDFCN